MARSARCVLMARSARCVLMARSARCHVRRRGSALSSRHSVGFSCRSAARTSRVRIALGSRLLRHRSVTNSVSGHSSSARRRAIRGFDCSLRSLRIALDSRLLRRRSPTKSVSARSSSARRRAIRAAHRRCGALLRLGCGRPAPKRPSSGTTSDTRNNRAPARKRSPQQPCRPP
jgi:hypothetical protein